MARVDKWLRSLLWENELPGDKAEHNLPFEIHRLKGVLAVKNDKTKIIQGVRELFEIFDAPASNGQDFEAGKVVLIGRRVTDFDFKSSLLSAIAGN